MAWQIEFEESAEKDLSKLDRRAQKDIWDFLQKRIATRENPRDFGEALRKNLTGLWKYRVGDYRILAEIQDQRLIVLIVRVGHRSRVYGGH